MQQTKEKIMKSKLPSKGDLLLCLMELCDEDDDYESLLSMAYAVSPGTSKMKNVDPWCNALCARSGTTKSA